MKLRDMPVSAKVREGESGLTFLVAAQGHPGCTGTTLVLDTVLAQHCLDAREPAGTPDRQKYGNSNFPESNLCAWLNSAEADWYRPAHPADAPPTAELVYDGAYAYEKEPGFLSRFPAWFQDALQTAEVPCYTLDEAGNWGLRTAALKVYIPSMTEIGFAGDDDPVEGQLIPLFRDYRMRVAAPDPSALGIADRNYFHKKECWWYWLRTPSTRGDCLSWRTQMGMGYGMHCGDYPCYGQTGVRPMLNLDGGVQVSEKPDALGVYDLLG